MKSLVTFERIGRNHDVAPLHVDEDGPEQLRAQVETYARRFLGSSDVRVVLQEDRLSGWIFAGVRTAGTFMVEVTP